MSDPSKGDTKTFSCTWRLGVDFWFVYFGVAALPALLGGLAGIHWLVGVGVGALVLAAIGPNRQARVSIGTDGIGLRWLVWRRFIPIADVVRARLTQRLVGEGEDGAVTLAHEVRLDLAGGKTLVLETGTVTFAPDEWHARRRFWLPGAVIHGGQALELPVPDPVGDALAREVRLAKRATLIEDDQLDGVVAALARGGRTARQWLDDLTRLRVRGDGYRDASIPVVALFQVLESPRFAPDVRVAAALALRPQTRRESSARDRIQAVAAACASDELRAALEATLVADDDDLLTAVERLR